MVTATAELRPGVPLWKQAAIRVAATEIARIPECIEYRTLIGLRKQRKGSYAMVVPPSPRETELKAKCKELQDLALKTAMAHFKAQSESTTKVQTVATELHQIEKVAIVRAPEIASRVQAAVTSGAISPADVPRVVEQEVIRVVREEVETMPGWILPAGIAAVVLIGIMAIKP